LYCIVFIIFISSIIIDQCPIDKLFIFLPVIWNSNFVVMLLVILWLFDQMLLKPTWSQ